MERWNGTSWSIVTSPNPSGTAESVLSSVSCPSTTSCFAVGSNLTTSHTKTLVEHWNGTSWSIVTSPNPSGATDSALSGVSCPTTTSCYAVGDWSTPTSDFTLIGGFGNRGGLLGLGVALTAVCNRFASTASPEPLHEI